MKFSYNWLQEYFKEKLPKPEKLAEFLTLRSFEVEATKKVGEDWILDIDVLPNRMPDGSGHIGVARELSAILDLKLKKESSVISNFQFPISNKISNSKFQIKNSKQIKANLEIKVEDSNLCPRYTAMLMENVKVGPSPEWLKERLESLGLNSINNAVDAANYVMLKTGQPLHIFDADKIQIENASDLNSKFKIQNSKLQSKIQNFEKEIFVRKAKKREKITTLDNKEYELDESILVIADSKEPLAIAGIKGGRKAEVDFRTKNIILESANFNGTVIRNGSKKLNLRTDASVRFSYNLDPNLTEEAVNRLAALIQELAGGDIVCISDFYPKKTVPTTIKLNFDKAKKIIGAAISDKEIKDILKRLNFNLQATPIRNQRFLTGQATYKLQAVIIPTIRRDLQIEEDLIEEIVRIYGYEKIKPAHPKGELIPSPKNNFLTAVKSTKDFFIGQGFDEIYNYSFVGEEDLSIIPKAAFGRIQEIQNPLSPDLKFLRPYLLFNVLKAVSFNFKNYENLRLFEIGKVFGDTISEKLNLAAILAGKNLESEELFYRLKGAASSLFETLGINDAWFDDAIDINEIESSLLSAAHPYRKSQIKIGDEIIGILGEIRSDILAGYDIKKGNAVFFELDFDALAKKIQEETEFRPFSKFPSVIRDLSLLVSGKTKVMEVEDIIENQGGKFLVDTDLFDIYEEEKFGGKKSLAFRLVFQSDEKTLSDDEVNKTMEKIIMALEENPDWGVRK